MFNKIIIIIPIIIFILINISHSEIKKLQYGDRFTIDKFECCYHLIDCFPVKIKLIKYGDKFSIVNIENIRFSISSDKMDIFGKYGFEMACSYSDFGITTKEEFMSIITSDPESLRCVYIMPEPMS